MSFEIARFGDITEYSTNAIINPQKSYRHPALRESASAFTVYGASAILDAKVRKIFEIKILLHFFLHIDIKITQYDQSVAVIAVVAVLK